MIIALNVYCRINNNGIGPSTSCCRQFSRNEFMRSQTLSHIKWFSNMMPTKQIVDDK